MAMIEITSDDYILCIAYAADKHGNDWMTMVKRGATETEWVGGFRFRDQKDNKIFDSEDEKYITTFGATNKSEQEMLELLNRVFCKVKTVYTVDADFILIQGDLKEFISKTCHKSWMHMKEERI